MDDPQKMFFSWKMNKRACFIRPEKQRMRRNRIAVFKHKEMKTRETK